MIVKLMISHIFHWEVYCVKVFAVGELFLAEPI